MRARLHERDAQSESFRDLGVRSPLDVAQHQHGTVGGGQLVDGRRQRRSQLRLHGEVVRGRRPVDHRGVVATALVEDRQHLVQRHFVSTAVPTAELLVRGVRHDAIEPRAECRLASKRVDLSDHRPQGVLHDFLRVRGTAGDAAGKTVGTLAVPTHEMLGRHRLATPERVDDVMVTVCAPAGRSTHDRSFEHRLKVHRLSSPLSVNVHSI